MMHGSPERSGGFTVLELMTTIALLVIVMGLMVSLARYVRTNAADGLTRSILVELDQALAQYRTLYGTPPAPLLPARLDEQQLATALQQSNQRLVEMLRTGLKPVADSAQTLPPVLSGTTIIRDAWGQPIGYLSAQHPLIGMAPQNRPFFFSAGPDGQYLTRQDNLYSYEQAKPAVLPGVPAPLDTANNTPSAGEPRRAPSGAQAPEPPGDGAR